MFQSDYQDMLAQYDGQLFTVSVSPIGGGCDTTTRDVRDVLREYTFLGPLLCVPMVNLDITMVLGMSVVRVTLGVDT